MTRLLFCVDHVFARAADGTIYTTGGKFPYAKWLEYLEYFDELVVVSRGRGATEEDIRKSVQASGPKVSFHLFDDLRGVKRLATLSEQRVALAREVDAADAVIGRIPSEIGIAGCDQARRAGKPWLVELVACPWDALWNHGSPLAKAYAPVMAHRMRRVARQGKLLHYVTREFLQRRYPPGGAFVCASNVMLPEPGEGLMERRIAGLQAWRRGDRPVVFGTIGALFTRLKGIDQAIEALAAARDGLPPFEYRVLGEGAPDRLRAVAERFGIADRVHFDGVLPGAAAVAGWLDGIDAYLQPSFQEGLPRATIEAMARGCLAIGSTVGGIPELLPAGRMHKPGAAGELRERILSLVQSPAERLAEESRRNFDVAQRYSYSASLAEKRRAYHALREWVRRGTMPGEAGQPLPDAA
ncbi:glycosyltransferase family 4 protein [Sphingomonas canadensis]|uniref:Glycosyltransferase family 4 protein n=1 Tax=Sphingomonas canadensis TaxID=1219257 RepID=A0ABW3H9V4_9SPHN|nr:glycosyltransferase family 4 protein [Sphingomonas canadensis]MCW3837125.1 glycosyltransferase family 4 protein [Sphingomonas canadensis]